MSRPMVTALPFHAHNQVLGRAQSRVLAAGSLCRRAGCRAPVTASWREKTHRAMPFVPRNPICKGRRGVGSGSEDEEMCNGRFGGDVLGAISISPSTAFGKQCFAPSSSGHGLWNEGCSQASASGNGSEMPLSLCWCVPHGTRELEEDCMLPTNTAGQH